MAGRTLHITRNKTGNASATVERADGESITTSPEDGSIGSATPVEPNRTITEPKLDDYELGSGEHADSPQFVDPGTGTNSDTGSGSSRRKRSDAGRPRGKRASRTTVTQTTSSIANSLFSVHFAMSNLLGSELLLLTKDESQVLAEAITNVSQYYDIPVMDEKMLAWINLASVAGIIYGPRFVAAKFRKQQKKKGNVVEMRFTQQPQETTTAQ